MALAPELKDLISRMSLTEVLSELEAADELISIHEKAIAKLDEQRAQLRYRKNRLGREQEESTHV